MELAALTDFMYHSPHANMLRPHVPLLAHVTEAASLLTISKGMSGRIKPLRSSVVLTPSPLPDILVDRGILKSAFPSLNPRQIRVIIGQYTGDDPADAVSVHVFKFFDESFNLKEYPVDLDNDAMKCKLQQARDELEKLV